MPSEPSNEVAVSTADIMRQLGRVNMIVTCPKSFRCFEPATGKMYYETELHKRGVAMTPDGGLIHAPTGQPLGNALIPLWNTSIHDDGNIAIYEGDICEVGVDTGFGSLEKRIALMRWSPVSASFSLHFNGRGTYAGSVQVRQCRKLGNEFQDKEISQRWIEDNK